METVISPDRYTQRNCYALGAALALAASTAFADAPAPQLPLPEASVKLAVADSTEHLSRERGRSASRRGTRTRGTTSYIYRTRMIYNYYIWDFAKEE